MKNKNKDLIIKAASWLILLILWQIASSFLSDGLLMASPLRTLSRLKELAVEKEFFIRIWGSALRICAGILVSIIAAIFYGILALKYKAAEYLIEPYISIMKSTPVAVFIILLLVILSGKAVPSAISFLISFPVIYNSFLSGLKNADSDLLEMAEVFRMKQKDIWKTIRLKAAEPYLETSLKVSVGMGWKAGIAAEIIGSTVKSIGEALYSAKIFLMTEDIFAYAIVIIILSLVTENLITWIVIFLYRSVRRIGL